MKERDERLRSHQPGNRGDSKTYPTITDAELEAAIALADEAHRGWSNSTTVAERAALVRRVGELHAERRDELAAIIVREMGKPTDQALGEIDFCTDIYSYYADNAEDLMKDEPITLLAGEGSALIRRYSLGVLLGIMPWNFPYYQVARFRRPQPDDRQHHPAQARPSVPRVGRGAAADVSATPASPRGHTSTSMPPTTRLPA